MNRIEVVGNISYLKEFEKCYTFSIAVQEGIKEGGAFYMNCVYFKGEYSHKLTGKERVFIVGSLQEENYKDKKYLKIICARLYILGNNGNIKRMHKENNKEDYNGDCKVIYEGEIPF